jgi:twitching motility protein PilT
MEDLLQPFRLRNEAVQLRRFTAADLASAAGSTVTAAQKFINRLEEREDIEVFTKESLPSGKRGHPVYLYRLTSTGIRMLARDVAPMAKKINEQANRAVSADPIAVVPEKSKEPAFGVELPGWVPVFSHALEVASAKDAAGVLIEPNEPTMLRVAAAVQPVTEGKIWTQEKIEAALQHVLTPWQSKQLGTRGWTAGASALVNDAFWGLRVKRLARGPAVELKRMPTTVPTIEDLYLPPLVGELAGRRTGLVLITGIGRSGRSRTMAAMVNRVNRTRPNRIITLEEPILYVHKREQSVIEQRQVALDIPDFASGLDQAVQDTPDFLAVSELSDPETVATALAAAEHSLIVGRVVSASPREALLKLVSFFPAGEQERVRSSVIANLAGIVSLTGLEPASGREPVAGAAVLMFDEDVRAALISDPSLESINERFEIDTPVSYSLRSSIEELYRHGKVNEAVVTRYRTRMGDFAVANSEPKQAARG